MTLPWVEKYRPKKRSDLIGNTSSINSVYIFLKNWRSNSSKPGLILLGPPGSGKTSTVLAISNELGYELIEINASDSRNKKSVKNQLGKSARSVNILAPRPRVLLMDEVDGLAGNSDRGGLNELLKIIKNSNYPIICTANDSESDKIKKLSKELRLIIFNRLDELDLFEVLEKISELENIFIEEEQIESIVENSLGDLRAAINDLEAFSMGDFGILENRNKSQTLTEVLNGLYRSKNAEEARTVLSYAPSNYRYLLSHIFDTAYLQCKTQEELILVYEQIAHADLILTRIIFNQNWKLLKHFFELLGPGITLSKNSDNFKKIDSIPPYPNSSKYIGIGNRMKKSANSVAIQVAPKLHVSRSQFIKNIFPYFLQILSGENGAEIAAWMDLKDDLIEIIHKKIPRSKIKKNIGKARKTVGKSRLSKASKIGGGTKFTLDPYLNISDFNSNYQDVNENIVKEEVKEEVLEDDEIVNKKSDALQTSLDDFF